MRPFNRLETDAKIQAELGNFVGMRHLDPATAECGDPCVGETALGQIDKASPLAFVLVELVPGHLYQTSRPVGAFLFVQVFHGVLLRWYRADRIWIAFALQLHFVLVIVE